MYNVPTSYFQRIHHIRPRFKDDVEDVLIFMASRIVDFDKLPNKLFKSKFNEVIRTYKLNYHRKEKTISNWRTEISALFGFIIENQEFTMPGRRAQELANDQDMIKFFKIFLYNFEYPGGHLKPDQNLILCQKGVKLRPAQKILKILLEAENQAAGKRQYVTDAEVTHCIFNDLRCSANMETVGDTWKRIKTNRDNQTIYDQTGDVTRYAGDILDYMVLANLLTRHAGKVYMNKSEADMIQIFVDSQDSFKGYEPFFHNANATNEDMSSVRLEWFTYINREIVDIDFTTDLSNYIKNDPVLNESVYIDFAQKLAMGELLRTKDIGDTGEALVCNHEIKKLSNTDKGRQLIHLVNFIPTSFGVGYDIQSFEFEDDGFEVRKYIEVKTTISRRAISFNSCRVTPNEWRTAKSVKDRYYIYRLLLSDNEKKLFIIQNPYQKVMDNQITKIPHADRIELRFKDSVGVYEELL